MLTAFYPIPEKLFPGYRVIQPFHAKVKYRVINGKVMISEVGISPMCMDYVHGMSKMRSDIQAWLEAKETHKVSEGISPIIPDWEKVIEIF